MFKYRLRLFLKKWRSFIILSVHLGDDGAVFSLHCYATFVYLVSYDFRRRHHTLFLLNRERCRGCHRRYFGLRLVIVPSLVHRLHGILELKLKFWFLNRLTLILIIVYNVIGTTSQFDSIELVVHWSLACLFSWLELDVALLVDMLEVPMWTTLRINRSNLRLIALLTIQVWLCCKFSTRISQRLFSMHQPGYLPVL